MPQGKLSPGEIEVLIDGESDDVVFDWLLIHPGIRSNPAGRPGPPTVEEALAALGPKLQDLRPCRPDRCSP